MLQISRLSIILLFFTCCKNPPPRPKVVKTTLAVTQPEAMMIKDRIEEAVNNQDAAAYLALFDPQLIREEIKYIYSANVKTNMISELLPVMADTSFLGPSRYKGHYQFVKRDIQDNLQTLLFRLYTPDFVDYHLYVLNKRGDNVSLIEVFSFLNQQSMIKRLSLAGGQSQGKAHAAKQFIEEENYLNTLFIEQKFEKALSMARQLWQQDKTRDESVKMLLRAMCYTNPVSASKEWEKMSDASRPSDYLANLVIGEKTGDYERAHRCISALHQLFNDSFLDYYTGRIYRRQKDYRNAIGALTKLYEEFPLFDDGILELIRTYYEADRKADALEWTEIYKETLDADQQKLDALVKEYSK